MDFISNKRNERYKFYGNLSKNAVAEGAKMGVPPADALAAKALADGIVAAMDNTDTAASALDGVRLVEKNVEAAALPQLRAKIRNWKTLPNYAASGSEGVLKLKGSPEPGIDPATYKPVITLRVEAGKVLVEFKKNGVDGMAIYMRLRGQTQGRRVGSDTESPFYDTTPLAQPGVAEVREYYARGLMGDDEVGLDSDIASITFAG